MEVVNTFYEDENRGHLKNMKSSMTLDFTAVKSKALKNANTVLASPDLQMLKLASPDLEKLIIQQSNGLVQTTPTLAGTPGQIMCPKSVTEEQEAYARGFVDALAELHKGKPGYEANQQVKSQTQDAPTYTTLTTVGAAPPSSNGVMLSLPTSSVNMPLSTTVVPQTTTFATTNPLPGSILPAASGDLSIAQTGGYQVAQQVNGLQSMPVSRTQSPVVSITNVPTTVSTEHMALKEEPQTVPDLLPINMESQERIKLERKRARNRVAARKCRTRKLERISRLEDRVAELKGHNNDLSQTATALRDQVCKLKQQILMHVNSGCKVMLAPNVLE